MKWLSRVRKPEREPAPKPTPQTELAKDALWIEELEERIMPNAIWSD